MSFIEQSGINQNVFHQDLSQEMEDFRTGVPVRFDQGQGQREAMSKAADGISQEIADAIATLKAPHFARGDQAFVGAFLMAFFYRKNITIWLDWLNKEISEQTKGQVVIEQPTESDLDFVRSKLGGIKGGGTYF